MGSPLGRKMGDPCVWCSQPMVRGVNVFTDDGEAEVEISGGCETCFDAACAEDAGPPPPPNVEHWTRPHPEQADRIEVHTSAGVAVYDTHGDLNATEHFQIFWHHVSGPEVHPDDLWELGPEVIALDTGERSQAPRYKEPG